MTTLKLLSSNQLRQNGRILAPTTIGVNANPIPCFARIRAKIEGALMRTWDTVAIIGVGLIGGSIGLALRERKLARRVIGIGRRTGSLESALARGCVTETTTS